MPVSLRLSTLSVSSKDLKVLRSLLGLSGGKSEQSWEVDFDRDDGDAVLVDVDNPDVGHELRPAAALTRRRDFAARFVLHKPIRSQQLLKLLSDLSSASSDPQLEDKWPILAFGDDTGDLPLAEHL